MDDSGNGQAVSFELKVLESRTVEEMVGKIRSAASQPGGADAVARRRDAHEDELWRRRGHDHVVVGTTLMYLQDAPDGMLVPHERFPDGREVVYTDAAHADTAYEPD
jgi:hypothetical protein